MEEPQTPEQLVVQLERNWSGFAPNLKPVLVPFDVDHRIENIIKTVASQYSVVVTVRPSDRGYTIHSSLSVH